jgi:hypothetical protein
MMEEEMKTRRDFLATMGTAMGAAAVLALPTVGPKNRPASSDIEKWLLTTGQGRLDHQLVEFVRRQIKAG